MGQVRVYGMRMARVNVTIPDDVLARARAAGLNVSQVAARALAEELDRRAKIAALDAYLRELDAELGELSVEETAEARAWADRAFGSAGEDRTARARRAG